MLGRRPQPWRRAALALVAVALAGGVVPADAFASPLPVHIADGYYAPVLTPGVPGSEQFSLSIAHQVITTMELTCFPNDAVAPILHGSPYANVFILPPVKAIKLIDGRFHFSGNAVVSSTPRLSDRVATTRFSVTGTYLPTGPSYHYLSSLDNEVVSTLLFRGTATATACAGLPVHRTFRLYVTRG